MGSMKGDEISYLVLMLLSCFRTKNWRQELNVLQGRGSAALGHLPSLGLIGLFEQPPRACSSGADLEANIHQAEEAEVHFCSSSHSSTILVLFLTVFQCSDQFGFSLGLCGISFNAVLFYRPSEFYSLFREFVPKWFHFFNWAMIIAFLYIPLP